MQGGGSGFLVLFFFCISSFYLQTLALVQGETLLAAARGSDCFENCLSPLGIFRALVP